MKTNLLIVFLCISSLALANEPQTIFPKTKIIRSQEWYAEQAFLWKLKIDENPSDPSAWMNYFLAVRYSSSQKDELGKIAEQSAATIHGTFEYHVMNGLKDGVSSDGYQHLLKAHALQPSNPMVYGDLVLFSEFMGKDSDRRAFARKLLHTGFVSPSLLNYSYNVLMSMEENSVLITDSDNTTLPLYLLQDALTTRNDVAVLNLEMLRKQTYRDARLPSLHLRLNGAATGQDVCKLLPEQNQDRNFYYALTLSRSNILSIKDHLYVVGLASQHSKSQPDNISIIKKNLESRFLLDYLTVDFNGESEWGAGKVLSANYLVPMLLLLEHYKSENQQEKAKQLEEKILQLAQQNGKALLVQNFLDGKANEVPFIPIPLKAKDLEGKYKLVKDNIYAGESEVTNAEYHVFLNHLKENNLTDLYERCRFQLDQYDEPALSFMKGYHENRPPSKKERYFSNHPVVNISYDAASMYCSWLTEQYNHADDRKFRKVRFRLPEINEWQVAALGYKKVQSWKIGENKIEVEVPADSSDEFCSRNCKKITVSFNESEILYPWYNAYHFRNKALNQKGCALGNFKWNDSTQSCLPRIHSVDGFALMSPVQSYFPNGIGLYDVVGNVAEMTLEKGKACGGSWNHAPGESTITSVNNYEKAGSDIGFRVFMEVIEP